MKFVFYSLTIFGIFSCATRKLESPPYKQYIKYESFGMLGEMAVLLSPHQIIVYKRGLWYEKTIKRHIIKKDWHTIKSFVEKVNLDSLAYFEAPSTERATDGASYASFEIYFNDSLYSSQYYDGGNPHKKLKVLDSVVFKVYNAYDRISWEKLKQLSKKEKRKIEEENNKEEIYTIVDNQPEFSGGMSAFYKYVETEMKYPLQAHRMGIEGKVFVEFVVSKNGSVEDVRVIRGLGAGCDKEAIRIIKNSPKWESGKQRGKPVNVRIVFPVYFKYQVTE